MFFVITESDDFCLGIIYSIPTQIMWSLYENDPTLNVITIMLYDTKEVREYVNNIHYILFTIRAV